MAHPSLTPAEYRAVAAVQIAALCVHDTVILTGGKVCRVKAREYVLHADNNRDRARWGTLAEIQADTLYFLTNGVLPKAEGGRW